MSLIAKPFLILGGIAALVVMLGAFGAHGWKAWMTLKKISR